VGATGVGEPGPSAEEGKVASGVELYTSLGEYAKYRDDNRSTLRCEEKTCSRVDNC
jgi:hypothetical protein